MKKWITLLFNYSGLSFIYRKFVPKDKTELPTGFVWIIGAYVAFYGLASNRYENRVDAIESRMSAILPLVGSKSEKLAIEQLVALHHQNIPIQPVFTSPYSAYQSMFGKGAPHQETIENTKGIIAALKGSLDSTNLSKGDFTHVDFSNTSFHHTNFENATVKKVNFAGADLSTSKGFTLEMLEDAITNTNTKLPYYLPYPSNVKPAGNFERIKISQKDIIPSFPYKAQRQFYLFMDLPGDIAAEDMSLSIDGKEFDNLYFDESVFGGFFEVPYAKPALLKISGDGLRESYNKSTFEWNLRASTLGYHDIDWNYKDIYEEGAFQSVKHTDTYYFEQWDADTTDAIGLTDSYFLVDPIIEKNNRFEIEAYIPKGKGETVGILFPNPTENNDDLDFRFEVFQKYADCDSLRLRNACEKGSFLLLNVPSFRIPLIIEDIEDLGQESLVVFSNNFIEIN